MTTATSASAHDGRTKPDDRVLEVVGRWLDLSELERRMFSALVQELTKSSELVEDSTSDLSRRFQELAAVAQAQMQKMETIITVARSIEVDGQAVPIGQAMLDVEGVLLKVIETILSVSKHAMRMVYALDDTTRDVEAAQQCAVQIEAINRQTRYLALNAAIEANRSGAAGSAFGVIALEIKNLSVATAEISQQVRERIGAVARGMRSGQAVLQEIATLDMSEHIHAKARLDGLVAGILAQNQTFKAVLEEAVASSDEMSATIGQLVVGVQFQDRAKQHVAHVIEMLGVLGEAAVSAEQATDAAYPGVFTPGVIDESWLDRILERNTLESVKRRLLVQLTGEQSSKLLADEDATEFASGGDVELF